MPDKYNPNTDYKYKIKSRYGITIEQYDDLFYSQSGLCAICIRPETAKLGNVVKRLSVDHNHKTGKVRGLLCNRCNYLLRLFEDNIDMLLNMTNYLKGEK